MTTRKRYPRIVAPGGLARLLLGFSALVSPSDRRWHPLERKTNIASFEETCGTRHSGYKAAAVIFFTRDGYGNVDRVLVGLEARSGKKLKRIVQQRYYADVNHSLLESVIVFPQGKKDLVDANSVDTAKREYIEETANFGGLAKYLDSNVFNCSSYTAGGATQTSKPCGRVMGQTSLMIFREVSKIVYHFCEVPLDVAAASESRASSAGTMMKSEYNMFWLSIKDLRRVTNDGKATACNVDGKTRYFYYFSLEPLLHSDTAREFLGFTERSMNNSAARSEQEQ